MSRNMVEPENKICLFGGSFDPIHNGHLQLAAWTQQRLSLSKIIFIPAAVPPHKLHITLTDPKHRLQMVNLAVEDYAFFEVSDVEIKRKGISYTIDTLNYFINFNNLSKDELFLLIGADSLIDFLSWKNHEKIINNCQLVVYHRTGIDLTTVASEIKERIILLDAPLINITATNIRQKIKNSEGLKGLLPPQVIDYIYKYGLYH